jgi:hypothetical protein
VWSENYIFTIYLIFIVYVSHVGQVKLALCAGSLHRACKAMIKDVLFIANILITNMSKGTLFFTMYSLCPVSPPTIQELYLIDHVELTKMLAERSGSTTRANFHKNANQKN